MAAKWPLVLACFLLNTCLAQLSNHPTKTNAVSIALLYPFTSCDQLITEFPFASAFLVAVETINSSREFNFSLSVQWNDTRCSELVGIATMSEQWKRGVKAFIGPGNQSYCATSARIAASWNIPMISYFCHEDVVSDKTLYPTFARTRPPNAQLSKSILAVLNKFSWKTVAIVYCDDSCFSQHYWGKTKEDMKYTFKENGIRVSFEATMPMEHEQEKFDHLLNVIKRKARIIILATNPEYAPAFMVSASKQGMTNGDYVYIVSTLSEIYLGQAVDYWWAGISGAVNQTEAKKAWNSVLTLVPSPHNVTKYKKFQKRVVAKLNDFHGFRNRTSQTPEITLHYAAYLYDAVYLYALALNKTISNGQHPRNGVAVVDNIKDIYFESVTGFHVHLLINSLMGHRHHRGNSNLQIQIICFHVTLFSGPTMRPDKNVYIVVAVIISTLIVACCALVIFFGRKYSFEKELANQIWKVNYGDIVRRSTMGIGLSRLSNMSELNTIGRRQSSDITLGTYKGNPVVIKRVEKDNIDLTRAVLLELKQIRDVHHVNLTKFFGACVDAPNICILTEFCSRGSLQEIILNEEIKLDIIFIHSFMLDIAMGMEHIHSVDIKFHGHLTSSNCVVDSRWVLKITDHGLREFKSANDLLSTRRTNNERDYSSMIMQSYEILLTSWLYYAGIPIEDVVYVLFKTIFGAVARNVKENISKISDLEIVGRVSEGSVPPFRPPLPANTSNKDLQMVMKICWKEASEDRPDFWEIRKLLKKLHGGKNNIVDKIIYMLEEHSLNLEKLVEKRTEQWIEEKKRTDELLHSMMPKSVADQLKRGKPVEAESFDEVTLFFSDIVGFTSLSSESTPLQIVTLLNDLYSAFDGIIHAYDVYKVETIGDAYMVVSGLPIRNGHQHAVEIADMALHFLKSVQRFEIRHRPHEKLKLRIGIHSGPVCAGVVGMKMPRYCLFGDTVNTASRMESNGEALKIHISKATKDNLDKIGGYLMQERGSIEIKGKGELTTYWLQGKVFNTANIRKTRSETSSFSSSGIEVEWERENGWPLK
ncbi:PREDICTED: atrial natriuretic peptide receptor 2-like [Acropora digitifera]|uniref:atrial natriuretic peptide receptor 2-like n=1 Tax=Acropora digitifera TaxID=70779 RepID=UPI00077ADABF|nr:PREDICTED: atrial natriuretic peptide receptor 2-like [Acropora digitifera]